MLELYYYAVLKRIFGYCVEIMKLFSHLATKLQTLTCTLPQVPDQNEYCTRSIKHKDIYLRLVLS